MRLCTVLYMSSQRLNLGPRELLEMLDFHMHNSLRSLYTVTYSVIDHFA